MSKAYHTHAEWDRMVVLQSEQDFLDRIASVKGPAFREYRRKWDLAGKFELELQFPLHIDFQLSTYCNYQCTFCPFGLPKDIRPLNWDRASGWFPFELFKRVIDEGVPLGLCAIDLSHYNEPLLHKGLIQFIDNAAGQGVLDILISTNAELLTPTWTEKLLGSGLTRLKVSLDAYTGETFEKVRIGGDFQKVVGNLEHFLQRKAERRQILPVTRVSFVKTRLNEHELDRFHAHWAPLVDYIAVQELIRLDEFPVGLVPESRVVNHDFRCHQPWHKMTIRPNGDVLPCCTGWGHQLVMGNANERSIREIWDSAPMEELRRLHREGRYYENSVCKKCAKSTMVP